MAIGREGRIVRELRRAGFPVLTRKQWGSEHRALYQSRRVTHHFPGKAKAFFAHVTVTNPSGDFAQDVRVVENIGYERFGTGISYNWCVDQRTGKIAVGMPHDAKGAHTLNDKGVAGFPENLNYYGHAIAWIANVGDTPSQDCKDAFAAIIAAEKKHGAARADAPIYPHSKFAWKECPLEVMRAALGAILRRSKTILTDQKDWFDMATKAELREVVDAVVDPLKHELAEFRANLFQRDLKRWKRIDHYIDRSYARERAALKRLRALAERLGETATVADVDKAAAELDADHEAIKAVLGIDDAAE